MISLRQLIVKEIGSDNNMNNKMIEMRIVHTYNSASTPTKKYIDEIFAVLTGWSLRSLLKMQKETK